MSPCFRLRLHRGPLARPVRTTVNLGYIVASDLKVDTYVRPGSAQPQPFGLLLLRSAWLERNSNLERVLARRGCPSRTVATLLPSPVWSAQFRRKSLNLRRSRITSHYVNHAKGVVLHNIRLCVAPHLTGNRFFCAFGAQSLRSGQGFACPGARRAGLERPENSAFLCQAYQRRPPRLAAGKKYSASALLTFFKFLTFRAICHFITPSFLVERG